MGKEKIEYDNLKLAEKLLDETPIPSPSQRMDDRFYEMLNKAKKPERKLNIVRWLGHSNVWKVAAGIILFVSGWLGGTLIGTSGVSTSEMNQLTGEIDNLKQSLVLTMMDQTSSVDRIQAVNLVGELNKVDDQVIQSLITTLNYDENDNVRLVALEALVDYSDQALVREELIRSIRKQTSPMVLLRLTEIMTALQEKRAANEFRELLKQADLNYSLRTQLNETIQDLS